MKGLFIKDFYGVMGMYKKNLLLVGLVYAVMGLAMKMPFFFYMAIWLMVFYSLGSISLDQSCNWDRYARTLPVSARQVTGAKYLLTLMFAALGTVYCLVLGCLAAWLESGTLAAIWECTFTTAVIVAVSLVTMSLMLPAAYKWGVEKARNGLMVVFAVVFALGFLGLGEGGFLRKLSPAVPAALERLGENTPGPLAALLCVAIGLACLAISWLASSRVYEKSEF